MAADPWWLRRPAPGRVVLSIGLALAAAAGVAALASRASPLAARSALPLSDVDIRQVYVSSDPSDPERVLATTQRRNTTVSRDVLRLGGRRYWLRRYGDPARPGLPQRRLLSSRQRGARLYVPIAATELGRALADAPLPAGAPGVRSTPVFLYEDRLFQGLFLELRFPLREREPSGDWRRFDLVAVRGGELRSVDWVLHPYPRYYRELIAAGRPPLPPAFGQRQDGVPELAFALYEDLERPPAPLVLPISLYREIGLMWGEQAPQLRDDRWQPERAPLLPAARPDAPGKARALQLLAIHLDARVEDEAERQALEHRLSELLGS